MGERLGLGDFRGGWRVSFVFSQMDQGVKQGWLQKERCLEV